MERSLPRGSASRRANVARGAAVHRCAVVDMQSSAPAGVCYFTSQIGVECLYVRHMRWNGAKVQAIYDEC